jgi:ubiquinone/menaquinone biosynthesis C-methylase UbiE
MDTNSEVKEISFFNDTSKSYLSEYDRTTTDGHSFRARREKVLALLPTSTGTVLDVACGPGILIDGLLTKGYKVVGVDAAPEMVARAQEHFAHTYGVSLQVANVYELPFADASFDVSTALGLLEYLDDEEKALDEIIRVTTKGGTLILTYPNASSPWRLGNRFFLWLYRPLRSKVALTRASGHPLVHREYHERDVVERLSSARLTVEKISYYNFKLIPYPFDQWFPRLTVWQSALLEYRLPYFLRKVGTGFIVRARKSA